MRIDLYRPNGLGDTLLLAPTLRALRVGYPTAHLHLWGQADAAYWLLYAGLCDSISDHRKGLRMRIKPDVFVGWDWDGENLRRATRAFGIEIVAMGSFIAPRGLHQARHCYEVTRAVLPQLGPYHTGAVLFDVPKRIEPAYQGAVLIHLGTTMNEKRWPVERYLNIAHRLRARGHVVAFLESPGDDYGDLVEAPILSRGVLPMSWLMQRAALYIGNDTGPTHLAALTGCPTLALFGGSQPACWSPIGPRVRVLQTCERLRHTDEVFWCRNHDCFRDLTVPLVEEAALEILKQKEENHGRHG